MLAIKKKPLLKTKAYFFFASHHLSHFCNKWNNDRIINSQFNSFSKRKTYCSFPVHCPSNANSQNMSHDSIISIIFLLQFRISKLSLDFHLLIIFPKIIAKEQVKLIGQWSLCYCFTSNLADLQPTTILRTSKI